MGEEVKQLAHLLKHMVDNDGIRLQGRIPNAVVRLDKSRVDAFVSEAESAPAPLAWSTERPTAAGDYLIERPDGSKFAWPFDPEVDQLTFDGFIAKKFRWTGPIIVATLPPD